MKKRLLAITLLISFVLCASACGNSGNVENGSTDQQTVQKTDESNQADYTEVAAAISATTWLYNGGSETTLNYIKFEDDKANMGQATIDGNGIHHNEPSACDYTIDDSNITVKQSDGAELVIPYVYSEGACTLGEGDYFSLEQVDEALQGYWGYDYESYGRQEGYLLVDNGNLTSERASEAADGEPGDYYYYGPDEGTYTLGVGYFDTDMFKGSNWFFNIIDGTPKVLYFDHVCEPADGFPGEDGYEF